MLNYPIQANSIFASLHELDASKIKEDKETLGRTKKYKAIHFNNSISVVFD
jgi:hypothetical protein